ncbi:probable Cytochrome c oxidase assembly protein COX16, mitochondrial [Saccharomycodes ludwigii]|uniref:Cytochrome c oxidase assembly protein COX16, mitochondrial n=2 Tax=Saccharomycodes ludwigii TaxID=36035 RepID=A0A376B9A9_9ASCO|nr:probable Cytochrome c oxidase assembly protein COX16, mitochondrial [Saccharomycodes ludwigii]
MVLSNKVFRSKREQLLYDATLMGRYQKKLNKNPFLYYGLPFCSLMVLASFWLSNFTSVRYEQHDDKQHVIDEEELVNLKRERRQVNVKDEYYKLQGLGEGDWEPVRVPRLDGESDNVF